MDLKKVERVYSNYAGVYDHIFGRIFHESRESAVRRLDIKPNERILEVGVGTGLSLPLYPGYCQVVGIDFSAGRRMNGSSRTAWKTWCCCGWMPAGWSSRATASTPSWPRTW